MTGQADGTGLTQWLANAAAGDSASLAPASGPEGENIEVSGLDARTHAMVCLAALIAGGERGTYDQHVATALDHGVTPDEIAGVLVALLPTAGVARVTAAAPAIRAALERLAGDIPAGLEVKSA
jgi:alkylhydroperoxidase/carboxymuconolactone decarboxylase family protein YurZ